MKPIDLQIHTTFSDGKLSPREIIDLAIQKGMKAIAITDHDSVDGIEEAIQYSKNKEIEFVPGIEISCKEPGITSTIDILGLFIDHKSPALKELKEKLKQSRIEEKKEIIKKLNTLGYDITLSELLEEANEMLGRPHIARILLRKYPNKFSTIQQIFDELLGDNKKAFVPRKKASIEEALAIIKEAKGISILAHPGRYLNETNKIVDMFIKANGPGIEVDYPYSKIIGIDNNICERFIKIAKDHNLLISGGSDFHDIERKAEIGDSGLTEQEFQKLKQYKAGLQ